MVEIILTRFLIKILFACSVNKYTSYSSAQVFAIALDCIYYHHGNQRCR